MESFLTTYDKYFFFFVSPYFSKDVNVKMQSNIIDIQVFILDFGDI